MDFAELLGGLKREEFQSICEALGLDRGGREKGNESNLNISRYVDTAEAEQAVDVGEAVRKLRQLEAERAAAEVKMNTFLKELGY